MFAKKNMLDFVLAIVFVGRLNKNSDDNASFNGLIIITANFFKIKTSLFKKINEFLRCW